MSVVTLIDVVGLVGGALLAVVCLVGGASLMSVCVSGRGFANERVCV